MLASVSLLQRTFKKLGIIRFYVGEVTWKASTPGTEEPSEAEEPSEECMKSQKIEEA
jgi:hypothetical protein